MSDQTQNAEQAPAPVLRSALYVYDAHDILAATQPWIAQLGPAHPRYQEALRRIRVEIREERIMRLRHIDPVATAWHDLATDAARYGSVADAIRYSAGYFTLIRMLDYPAGEWADPVWDARALGRIAVTWPQWVERVENGRRSRPGFLFRLTDAGREIAQMLAADSQ